MHKIIAEINHKATADAAEINRLSIEGRTHNLQKISTELLPNAKSKSRNFFNRQTRVYDEMQRWSITGRFKFWLALLKFGAPLGFDYTIGKIVSYCARLDELHGEEIGLKGFPIRLRPFFEIKEEFDCNSARMPNLFIKGDDYELKKLIKRQTELLKEIESGLENSQVITTVPMMNFGNVQTIN